MSDVFRRLIRVRLALRLPSAHIRVPSVVLIVLLLGGHARAATIYTFDVAGTNTFDTTPLSFSYDPGPPSEFVFSKPVDASTDDFALATALGSTFGAATFIAYDSSIDPANELFRYSFAGSVQFLGWQLSGETEIVTLTANAITRTAGVAPVPEPASLLLLGTGLLGAGVRRWKRRARQ